MVFFNLDGYHVTADLGDNPVLDGNGFRWFGGPTNGPIDISVIPVNYSGLATESVSVAYCAVAAAVTIAAPGPFDFSFSGEPGLTPAAPCAGYSTAASVGPAVPPGPFAFGAEIPAINSVQDGGAGPFSIFTNPDNPFTPAGVVVPAIAIDFLGPGVPGFAANPNGRQNGWINDVVGLVGSNTGATDDDWIINGAADTGVGGYNRWLRLDTTSPAAGIGIANALPLWAFTAYAAATTNAAICTGTAAACASPTFPSTVLSVAATGTTATFPNPFARVDFYAADATTTDLRLIGSVAAGSATLVDDGATRVWTSSLTVTGPAFYAAIAGTAAAHTVNVYAFGVNAAGSVALVSGAVAQTVNTGP